MPSVYNNDQSHLTNIISSNGNLLTKTGESGTEFYAYNGFNQQTSHTIGTTTAAYAYNPNEIRTAKTVGNDRTSFLLDGSNVVGELQNNTVSATYLRGVNLISRETDSGTDYYLYNAHGDVVNLTNAAGALTRSYTYDAFGIEKNPDTEDTNPFRYCGEYYDTETGTYYLRARYYAPTLGRFTQVDPIQEGFNWFVYCSNNPVSRTDPSGLKDYIYTSHDEYYIENDWGKWDFLHKDRYFVEINGARYQALSKETVELYDWVSIDTEFLNESFLDLVEKADEQDVTPRRVLSQSVGGDLDFKLQMNEDTLYLIKGILYNKNEAGNFVWAYYLESHHYSGVLSGALAQGGSFLPPLAKMSGKPRLDESWDRAARWAGVKYYHEQNNSLWLYHILYGGKIKP